MAQISDNDGNIIAMARCSEDIRPFISGCHFYICRQDRQYYHDDIIFPGWFNVRFIMPKMKCSFSYDRKEYFELPKMLLFGPSTRIIHSRPIAGTFIGFGLTPIGFSRLFNIKAKDCVNKVLDLEQLWGQKARRIYSDLMEVRDEYEAMEIFCANFRDVISLFNFEERRALALFNFISQSHDENLENAAQKLKVSSHQLRRTSKRFFGFTPKLLLRRSRFLKSILAINAKPNESPAPLIDSSYVDYSHFVKDCRYFFNMTPLEFVQLNKPMAEMSLRLMMQLTGAPMQSLQKIKIGSG